MAEPAFQFVQLQAIRDRALIQSFHREALWPVPAQGSPELAEHQAQVRWVCVERAGVPIGIARLELAPPEFCYVAHFLVRPRWQRRGVGSWLLRAIEAYCRTLGIMRLSLQATQGSQSFYESMYFRPDPLVPQFLKKEISPLQKKAFLGRP
ncbi:MAG: GNAT family N-acetyltransferase [Pseudomonadota bacterium]